MEKGVRVLSWLIIIYAPGREGTGPMAEIIILAPAMMTVYQPIPKSYNIFEVKRLDHS